MTVSIHQEGDKFYPPKKDKQHDLKDYKRYGKGNGYEFNINIPLQEGAGDLDVLFALEGIVLSKGCAFAPDIAYLAIGTDDMKDDGLANTVFKIIIWPNCI